jgi:NADPH:quinone reductase-like Zn-dependent oxidoreductase
MNHPRILTSGHHHDRTGGRGVFECVLELCGVAMHKIVIHRPGGYERLILEEHPTPEPGAGEVRVRTHAVGVNYADIAVRWGLYASARQLVGWPITPGFEFAGEIEATGPGVQQWAVGERVFGVTLFGGYATHVVVPAHQVFRLPPQLTLEQAAGFPTVYLTAFHALFQNIVLREGMSVLVHSAAGGVGLALLQLGALAGCRMVGVVGAPHKVELARRYGAHEVIDKSADDLWARAEVLSPRGYDVVLDANGVETLAASYAHLAPTGKLVSYGFHSMLPRTGGRVSWPRLAWGWLRTPRFNPLDMTSQNKSLVTFNLSFLFDRVDLLEEGMTGLLGWLGRGELLPPPVTAWPLAEVAGAHRALESGQTAGKLVLTTGPRSMQTV